MTISADPDQLASSEASWSGSTLFVKAGHIRVQQDKGYLELSEDLTIAPLQRYQRRYPQCWNILNSCLPDNITVGHGNIAT